MESFPKTHFYVLNKCIHTYISKQVYLGQLKLGWAVTNESPKNSALHKYFIFLILNSRDVSVDD